MTNLTRKIKLTENPFILFSPFLFIYIVFILFFNNNLLCGDENNYITFSKNLIHGFYSPPAPDIDLKNGPGYPMILTPFLILHFPLLFLKLMNAAFQYLSIVFLFKAMKHIASFSTSLIFSLIWACDYNLFDSLAILLSEVFTSFLIALSVFLIMKAFKQSGALKNNLYLYLCGFTIGYIALTKVIFGYVLLAIFIGIFALWMFNKKDLNYRSSLIILITAILTTAPYLIYTYQLTGRAFYWGTTGGNNLYWMSSPVKEEYGSWFPNSMTEPDSNLISESYREFRLKDLSEIKTSLQNIPGTEDYIKFNHSKDFEEINRYKGIEQDDIYRRIAIRNIKSNPEKFIQNCISNLGRIFFNYPYSYKLQAPSTLVRLPYNGFLLFLMLISFIPTLFNWRKISFPLRLLLSFAAIYLGGSLLASAETRMFTVIAPIMILWISYVLPRIIKINLKFNGEE